MSAPTPEERRRVILQLARSRGWRVDAPGGDGGPGPSGILGEEWQRRTPAEREEFLGALRLIDEVSGITVAGSVVSPGYAATLPGPARAGKGGAVALPVPAAQRYVVQKEAARGGMGRILLAMDTVVGREVALKELLPGAGGGFGAERERFLREARITGQLEHPNIVPVYEIGERAEGAAYYTMKFVRGETMEARIRRVQQDSRLSARQRLGERLKLLDAYVDTCQAVAYAHSRGIVNRDLKPANVMIGDFGETVVLDWGLARVRGQEDVAAGDLHRATQVRAPSPPPTTPGTLGPAGTRAGDTTRLTLQGDVVGTPVYMAPEQARGDIDAVDEKSDVYALGVMLYEILTGRLPFEGATLEEILRAVIHEAPEPVGRREPLAPRELAAVASAAMRKDRGERLDSAGRLADEVKAWRDGRPMALYRHTPWEQVRRFARHNRALASALCAAALILLAGAVTAGVLARNERAARRQADVLAGAERDARAAESRALEEARGALRVAEGQRLAAVSGQIAKDNPTAALNIALEAGRMAPGKASTDAIWAALAMQSERRRFIGHEGTILDIRSTPDGRMVATGGTDQTARIWDTATGLELVRLDGHVAPVGHVRFMDGERLLLTAPAARGEGRTENLMLPGTFDFLMYLWDTQTGVRVATLRGHTSDIRGVQVLGDGRIASWSNDGTLRLWEREREVRQVAGQEPVDRALVRNDGKHAILFTRRPTSPELWSLAADAPPVPLGGAGSPVLDAAFLDSGDVVAARLDGAATVHDPQTGEEKRRVVVAPDVQADGVWVNRTDGRVAISTWFEPPPGSGQAPVRRLSVYPADLSGKPVTGTLQTGVNLDRMSPDWRYYIHHGAYTDRASVHEFPSGLQVASCDGHEYLIDAVVFGPDGSVLTGSRDREGAMWSPVAGAALRSFRWSRGRTDVREVARDGSVAVTLEEGGVLRLRDNGTGEEIGRCPRTWTGGVRVSALPNMREMLVWYPGQPTFDLWDCEAGTLHAVTGDGRAMWFDCASPDSDWILVACPDNRMQVLSLRGKQEPAAVDGYAAHNRALSPGGRFYSRVHAGEGLIDVHAAAGGEKVGSLRGHQGFVIHSAWFPDSRIATTGMDASIRVWEPGSWKPVAQGRWPRINELYLAVSADGRYVAAFGAGEGRVYSSDTMEEIAQVPKSQPVGWLGFTRDSRFLVVSADAVWMHFPLDVVPAAEAALPRALSPLEFRRLLAKTQDDSDRYSRDYARRYPRPMVPYVRGIRKLGEGDVDGAIGLFREAIAQKPGAPDTWISLGEALARKAASLPAGDAERARAEGEALDCIAEAVERGYRNPGQTRRSAAFAGLQASPRWEAIEERSRQVGK